MIYIFSVYEDAGIEAHTVMCLHPSFTLTWLDYVQ